MKIIIDKKEYLAEEGQTVLDVCRKNGIEIPALCYHPDLGVKANCRMCLVEIVGQKKLQTSCSTKVFEGMEVITNSVNIRRARKINLELIVSSHIEKCATCIWDQNCSLQKLAREYGVFINRFSDRKKDRQTEFFGPAIEFDQSKCIDCGLCVEMCQKQQCNVFEVKGKGSETTVTAERVKDCSYCGQCVVHCPVGALQGKGEWQEVEKALNDKNKILIAQCAPSIRASIGEEFNLPYGQVVTGQMVAALKKLGFDKVFDINLGADFTSFEEAKELKERLEAKKLPMFTSCCPAWVRFVEVFYPEFIPNLTTANSPQMCSGPIIKTYYADKIGKKPSDIVTVSIMPCTSKKYEAKRDEFKFDDGTPYIDHVITTREFAYLLRRKGIELCDLAPEEPDNPLGKYSGAGAIYGASGGVMESALRTAVEWISGKKPESLEFTKVRGQEGIKRAEVLVGDKTLKVAVANGLGNAKLILEELKKNPKTYDYVEIMACPGGCIGGGGQPVPVSPEIRKKRADSLYNIDKEMKIRTCHENPSLIRVYDEMLDKKPELIEKLLHTSYLKKKTTKE